jgi:hypothetical protein
MKLSELKQGQLAKIVVPDDDKDDDDYTNNGIVVMGIESIDPGGNSTLAITVSGTRPSYPNHVPGCAWTIHEDTECEIITAKVTVDPFSRYKVMVVSYQDFVVEAADMDAASELAIQTALEGGTGIDHGDARIDHYDHYVEEIEVLAE